MSEHAQQYGEAAPIYRAAGWNGVLPLPAGKKFPPPPGFTGDKGKWPTDDETADWVAAQAEGNLSLRLPGGIVGLDFDFYKRDGETSYEQLTNECGPLPATWTSTSRDDGSGINLFRVPEVKLLGAPAPGFEVIQRHHRYVVAWPSVHPSGSQYAWITPDAETVESIPCPDELPWLPDSWLKRLTERDRSSDERKSHPFTGEWSPKVGGAIADAIRGMVQGCRHDTATASALALARYEVLGHPGASEALEGLGSVFRAALQQDRATAVEADREWRDVLGSAREKVAETPPTAARWDDEQSESDGAGSQCQQKPSQATLLVELVEAGNIALVHDLDGDPYALVEEDHREVWRLGDAAFRTWLSRTFYEQHGQAPGSQALTEALGVLGGKARFEGDEHEVHVRVAAADGAIHIDLADDAWRAVEVTAEHWTVVDQPPVLFRRPKALLPLPEPQHGGSVDQLRSFVNVTDQDWPVILAWLVGALHPTGPYVALTISGEQGSAKSTTCRVLRSLIDPNTAPLRSQPRREHDLVIAAKHSRIVGFDNLSGLPPEMSDALCRLATGSGFGTRMLYSNDEEAVFAASRPILANGIGELSAAADLLDRCMIVECPRIQDDQRCTEEDLWRDWERERPMILGAILDAVARSLANHARVTLEPLPRMADFARWAVAAAPAFGIEEGDMLEALLANRARAATVAIDGDPVAEAIVALLNDVRRWEGISTELLAILNERQEEQRPPRGWPASARAMGHALRRLAPDLRRQGIDVNTDRRGAKRRHILEQSTERTSPSSPTSPDEEKRRSAASSGGDVESDVPVRDSEQRHRLPPTTSPTETAPNQDIHPNGDDDDVRDVGRRHHPDYSREVERWPGVEVEWLEGDDGELEPWPRASALDTFVP